MVAKNDKKGKCIHHMIVIYCAHLIAHKSIFQNFDFLGSQGMKEQKMAQNDKKFCITHYISGTMNHMTFIYSRHM